ncbi:arylamine N-acetyltransferase family protein [Novosphingobium umbonatum]|uniref:arylamine N-acetyltransferase family protein n=1 Tax=Novosphingobium umbonatum TaxID=1908524 RepID=UPI0015F2B157|nr:arylamine N-acetyltransferase [Novosphingobium umbonatum]
MISDFLAAYLERIALPLPKAVTLEVLEQIQLAHRMAIGFENMDVMLGRGISVELPAIHAKLVERMRGGYCFEHNALFGAALEELGFPNRPLLGRVWLNVPEGVVPPRTHTLRLVELDGAVWIADAGFGGSYVPVMRLADGAIAQTADGAQHRLSRVMESTGEWVLERAGPVGATDGRAQPHTNWQRQYSFDLAPVMPVDLEMSNHWTSAKPNTRFTSAHIASIVLPNGGFAALNGRRLSMYSGGRADVMELPSAADWRRVLGDLFNIELSVEEIDALYLF